MVMLQRWSVEWRENGHVTEVVTLLEREWSCYRCGQFYRGRMVILQRCSLLLHSMVNGWFVVSCIQYILPLNLLIFLFLFINVFLHTAKFLHTGEREDFMPAKIEQVCQSREGE